MTDFDDVYRQHLQAVSRYALKCVGRRDIAEEVTSEAFTSLFRAFDRIDPVLLPGWLFTAVRNRAIDFWRHAALEKRYQSELESEPIAPSPAGGIQQWLDAVPSLKPVHRACLILRYVHGMERAEIAARLGLSENQVKGHLQYSHQLLRKQWVDSE
jgi:RNA polymerase sigma-70 factor (ECF subfamily)